ncbi:MAG: tRNA lysidine(34) synthetase TilS [Erysipelotrichaceae bacterium]
MKKNKLLLGVSGGPDSMYLLDILRKEGHQLYVAHVNYQVRDSAINDENIVIDYCEKYKIPVFVSKVKINEGNFQDEARKARYLFFKGIYEQYNLDALAIAHQQDDVLETYVMQRKRNITPVVYGIAKKTMLFNMEVIRPILDVSRKMIITYLGDNGIAYGLDESNDSDKYLRNKIRHHVISEMSDGERKKLLEEIKNKNKELTKDNELIIKSLDLDFSQLDEDVGLKLLRYQIVSCDSSYHNISLKYLKDIYCQLINNHYFENKKIIIELDKSIKVVKIKDLTYNIEVLDCGNIKYPFFEISDKGSSFEGCVVKSEDFPLTIRNYHQGDCIAMKYGHKKVNRWFIDNKIRLIDRKIWPIVQNCQNEIILVPKIGCNVTHYGAKFNLFVIKY